MDIFSTSKQYSTKPNSGRSKSTLAYQDCQVTLVPKWKLVLSATMLNRYFSASSTVQHTA